MAVGLGPILSFRGCDSEAGRWHVSAILVSDAPVQVRADDSSGTREVASETLWTLNGRSVYRYDFWFTMSDRPATGSYSVDGSRYEVAVPAAGAAPRMAYHSCNGFSSLKLMKSVRDKNCMWKELGRRHSISPYHLLLQGGDQIYADSMWETVPSMRAWNEKAWEAGNRARLTARMQRDLDRFYFDLYVSRLSQPELAPLLASIPTIGMWDDHDIIDGWGSYPPERQNCPVFGGIWASASKAFSVFQQQVAPGASRPGALVGADSGYTFGYVIGPVAVLALDMRTQRTQKQVIARKHWDTIYEWLEGLEDIQHLLVLSSIPVVYPGFDMLEQLLGFIPGHQDLEDDLKDHWRSRSHKGERLRLVHRLLDLSRDEGIRPTLISGDVHVAALGLIESVREQTPGNEAVINQLISSGIVHPGPGATVLFALKYLFDSDDEIDRGIVARMTEFPGNTAKFIGSRNFLSLEPDEGTGSPRIWANWIVEDEVDEPYTKVIHPLRAPSREAATARRAPAA